VYVVFVIILSYLTALRYIKCMLQVQIKLGWLLSHVIFFDGTIGARCPYRVNILKEKPGVNILRERKCCVVLTGKMPYTPTHCPAN
jgi:hypothetical protein